MEDSRKISCNYTWRLHGNNCSFRWRFLRRFLTASKLNRRSITAAKRKERYKKERQKKKKKNEKSKSLKTWITFSSATSGKKGCRVANAFSTRLKLIWPRSSLNTTKISKKRIFWQKAPEVNGLEGYRGWNLRYFKHILRISLRLKLYKREYNFVGWKSLLQWSHVYCLWHSWNKIGYVRFHHGISVKNAFLKAKSAMCRLTWHRDLTDCNGQRWSTCTM